MISFDEYKQGFQFNSEQYEGWAYDDDDLMLLVSLDVPTHAAGFVYDPKTDKVIIHSIVDDDDIVIYSMSEIEEMWENMYKHWVSKQS